MAIEAPSPTIRILVVDDSAFMRKAITMMLESDPLIKVIGTARDGEEGVEKVRLLKPDLVTMDIEMPRMDGLAALREIMLKSPVPVMMVSSLTTSGAQATLEALDLGAVDFIPKQMSYVSLDIVKIKEDLIAKIKDIAKRKHILMSRHRQRQFSQIGKGTAESPVSKTTVQLPEQKFIRKRQHQIGLVAIGSSTGGPPALQSVITKLPRNFPVGVVIAQHMPPMFTKSLADRLNTLSTLTVREAQDGERIEAGLVLVAPGGRHLTVKRRGGQVFACVSDEPSTTLYKPCVDVMLNSVAETYGQQTMGVILTGMGNNGIQGIRQIRSKGGVVIAQNEQTCVVYGMPRAVIEAGVADHIAPIESIAAEIASYF
ncbi:MAG: chemotaxis response regulator protein-glutamate methylesterase [bacterium]|nr:chemotaxis response regulator protein-glutamate methylesterase [bacterium]